MHSSRSQQLQLPQITAINSFLVPAEPCDPLSSLTLPSAGSTSRDAQHNTAQVIQLQYCHSPPLCIRHALLAHAFQHVIFCIPLHIGILEYPNIPLYIFNLVYTSCTPLHTIRHTLSVVVVAFNTFCYHVSYPVRSIYKRWGVRNYSSCQGPYHPVRNNKPLSKSAWNH